MAFPAPHTHSARMHHWLVAASFVVVLAACSPGGNVNGTLRGNQVTLFEGQHWTDARCSESRGSGLSPLNCCFRHGDVCLDFVDYLVSDVRVLGQRVVVLVTVNAGVALYVSDDLGATWKATAVGSVGGIATFQSMALHLAGRAVYLMVQTQEAAPLGGRVVVYPYEVDLETGVTTRVALSGADWLYARPHAWSAPDGTSIGVTFLPEDARDPGSRCMVRTETWKPGSAVQVTMTPAGFSGCTEGSVPASDDGRFFPLLVTQPPAPACVRQYDAATDSMGGSCVPWGTWPALRQPGDLPRFAAQAGRRAWRYGVFALEDTAWAVTLPARTWVSLGRGAPQDNRRPSGRQPFAGLVPLRDAAGTSRLVRINADDTADEVLLPLSPCTGDAQTCFDPKSAEVFHGEVGDVQWVEPLGDDQYLVFFVHDLAPGINQYKALFTVSKETATYRRVTPLERPTGVGPAGYPNAKPAGPIELVCLKQLACGGAPAGLQDCAGLYYRHFLMTQTNLDGAVAEAAAADCSSLLLSRPGAFACRARGGTPVLRDDGQGQSLLECDFGASVAGAACGTCVGDVAVACASNPSRVEPIDCSAGGATCQAGRCVPATACVGGALYQCREGVGVICSAQGELRARCDLLNLGCDVAAQVPGWNPCVGTGIWRPTTTASSPRCEGEYLLWELNSEKWANCVELGFSGCQGDRCVP